MVHNEADATLRLSYLVPEPLLLSLRLGAVELSSLFLALDFFKREPQPQAEGYEGYEGYDADCVPEVVYE